MWWQVVLSSIPVGVGLIAGANRYVVKPLLKVLSDIVTLQSEIKALQQDTILGSLGALRTALETHIRWHGHELDTPNPQGVASH
jgi:hypothetical protein